MSRSEAYSIELPQNSDLLQEYIEYFKLNLKDAVDTKALPPSKDLEFGKKIMTFSFILLGGLSMVGAVTAGVPAITAALIGLGTGASTQLIQELFDLAESESISVKVAAQDALTKIATSHAVPLVRMHTTLLRLMANQVNDIYAEIDSMSIKQKRNLESLKEFIIGELDKIIKQQTMTSADMDQIKQSIEDQVESLAKITKLLDQYKKENGANTEEIEDLKQKLSILIKGHYEDLQTQEKLDNLEKYGYMLELAENAGVLSYYMIAFIDPQAAKKFHTAFNGLANLGNAYFQLSKKIISGSSSVAISASALGLVGSIAGLLFTVFSLFQSEKPSLLVHLSKQLEELTQLVAYFRKEVHQRFDRIENMLEKHIQILFEVIKDIAMLHESVSWMQEKLSSKIMSTHSATLEGFSDTVEISYLDEAGKILEAADFNATYTSETVPDHIYYELNDNLAFFINWAKNSSVHTTTTFHPTFNDLLSEEIDLIRIDQNQGITLSRDIYSLINYISHIAKTNGVLSYPEKTSPHPVVLIRSATDLLRYTNNVQHLLFKKSEHASFEQFTVFHKKILSIADLFRNLFSLQRNLRQDVTLFIRLFDNVNVAKNCSTIQDEWNSYFNTTSDFYNGKDREEAVTSSYKFDYGQEYSHILLHKKEEPTIEGKFRGYYLYRYENKNSVYVLIIHDKDEHETICLSDIIKEREDEILLAEIEWPIGNDTKILLNNRIVELIEKNCAHTGKNENAKKYIPALLLKEHVFTYEGIEYNRYGNIDMPFEDTIVQPDTPMSDLKKITLYSLANTMSNLIIEHRSREMPIWLPSFGPGSANVQWETRAVNSLLENLPALAKATRQFPNYEDISKWFEAELNMAIEFQQTIIRANSGRSHEWSDYEYEQFRERRFKQIRLLGKIKENWKKYFTIHNSRFCETINRIFKSLYSDFIDNFTATPQHQTDFRLSKIHFNRLYLTMRFSFPSNYFLLDLLNNTMIKIHRQLEHLTQLKIDEDECSHCISDSETFFKNHLQNEFNLLRAAFEFIQSTLIQELETGNSTHALDFYFVENAFKQFGNFMQDYFGDFRDSEAMHAWLITGNALISPSLNKLEKKLFHYLHGVEKFIRQHVPNTSPLKGQIQSDYESGAAEFRRILSEDRKKMNLVLANRNCHLGYTDCMQSNQIFLDSYSEYLSHMKRFFSIQHETIYKIQEASTSSLALDLKSSENKLDRIEVRQAKIGMTLASNDLPINERKGLEKELQELEEFRQKCIKKQGKLNKKLKAASNLIKNFLRDTLDDIHADHSMFLQSMEKVSSEFLETDLPNTQPKQQNLTRAKIFSSASYGYAGLFNSESLATDPSHSRILPLPPLT